ncbi:MAG: transketolase C-terminal domain-containing protein, partial [Caldimonas sp.]
QDHPVAVRYPRGSGAGKLPKAAMTEIPFGKGEIRRESTRSGPQAGKRIAILAFGTLLYPALAAADKLDATVANMRFAKPLDVALVTDLARRHDAIVTVEEGALMGGAGSAVLEALAEARIEIPVLTLGLPDVFSEHGDPARLLALYGLDAAGIEQSIQRRFGTMPALMPALVRSVAGA